MNIIDRTRNRAYNQREMFRRRKKKNATVNDTQSEFLPSVYAPNSDTSSSTAVVASRETKISPSLTDALKSVIEKAADRLKNQLASEGKLKPMAFFMHADSAMKTVSLSYPVYPMDSGSCAH